MLCVDTSFLFSLYHPDEHTDPAYARLDRAAEPLLLSPLNLFEFENALRFAAYRKLITHDNVQKCQSALRQDGQSGRWFPSPIALPELMAEANALSAAHTARRGHRSFDILHVAHARLAKPTAFLSFDLNQLRLARSAGLRC